MDYTFDEFSTECGAYAQRYQQALDLLYDVGCTYSINDSHMRLLCDHTGVAFDDLLNHNTSNSINTTKAIPCQ